MPERMDGGDAILEALRNLDVDYIISSPGSEWPSVWEALARQAIEERPGPTYINCWHETLAVAMASGYTRMTGRMQAVLLHAGVGVLQGSMGIHGAYQSEVPMLVCSGESATYGEASDFDPGPQWLRNLSIVGGPNRLVEPFTKWSSRVTSPETLYETVSRAGELAQRTPKGPSFLNIPMEVMREEWKPRAGMRRRAAVPRSFPDPDAVEQVADLIRRSSNPVISTGSAGRTPEGFNNLLALAESLSIPVFESEGPSCANFPKSHPLHRGYDLSRELERYDLFLVVGNPAPWYPPSAGPANATVVVIDELPDQGVHGLSRPARRPLPGRRPARHVGGIDSGRRNEIDRAGRRQSFCRRRLEALPEPAGRGRRRVSHRPRLPVQHAQRSHAHRHRLHR